MTFTINIQYMPRGGWHWRIALDDKQLDAGLASTEELAFLSAVECTMHHRKYAYLPAEQEGIA